MSGWMASSIFIFHAGKQSGLKASHQAIMPSNRHSFLLPGVQVVMQAGKSTFMQAIMLDGFHEG